MSLFQPNLLAQYLISPAFFHAAGITFALSIASLAVGMVLGLLLAMAQEVPLRAVRVLVVLYLWLFRGTPALLQLVFAFNVLPSLGILLPGFACGVLALGLNEGAYMAEIMRSGIRAVGAGQRLAARALGLEDRQVMRWVVLPQALRIIIPPIGNQFISMLKLSALASVIGVQELLLVADQAASGNFRYIETLSAAGVYYLAMTTVFMAIQSGIEYRLRRRPGTRRGMLTGMGRLLAVR